MRSFTRLLRNFAPIVKHVIVVQLCRHGADGRFGRRENKYVDISFQSEGSLEEAVEQVASIPHHQVVCVLRKL